MIACTASATVTYENPELKPAASTMLVGRSCVVKIPLAMLESLLGRKTLRLKTAGRLPTFFFCFVFSRYGAFGHWDFDQDRRPPAACRKLFNPNRSVAEPSTVTPSRLE
jgi:hypothetical protein